MGQSQATPLAQLPGDRGIVALCLQVKGGGRLLNAPSCAPAVAVAAPSGSPPSTPTLP